MLVPGSSLFTLVTRLYVFVKKNDGARQSGGFSTQTTPLKEVWGWSGKKKGDFAVRSTYCGNDYDIGVESNTKE